MEEEKFCKSCGANLKTYAYKINHHLAKGLYLLRKVGGTSKVVDLALTKAQHCNFTKLQHWGLIRKGKDSFTWEISQRGLSFLEGSELIPKYSFVYRNDVQGYSASKIDIYDAFGDYSSWYKDNYLENAIDGYGISSFENTYDFSRIYEGVL